MRRSTTPVSTKWKTTYNQTWAKRTMRSICKRPNTAVAKTLAEKTEALKVMSMDMSSAGSLTRYRNKSDRPSTGGPRSSSSSHGSHLRL